MLSSVTLNCQVKMTGGTPDVRFDKSLTNGPMDQWTNGPIDQWINRPMDQWTNGLKSKASTKTASTPNICCMLFCRDAIFVANLRTFLAYNLQAKKWGGVQKMTNMRYGGSSLVHRI